jgi:hypothetical protein
MVLDRNMAQLLYAAPSHMTPRTAFSTASRASASRPPDLIIPGVLGRKAYPMPVIDFRPSGGKGRERPAKDRIPRLDQPSDRPRPEARNFSQVSEHGRNGSAQ